MNFVSPPLPTWTFWSGFKSEGFFVNSATAPSNSSRIKLELKFYDGKGRGSKTMGNKLMWGIKECSMIERKRVRTKNARETEQVNDKNGKRKRVKEKGTGVHKVKYSPIKSKGLEMGKKIKSLKKRENFF